MAARAHVPTQQEITDAERAHPSVTPAPASSHPAASSPAAGVSTSTSTSTPNGLPLGWVQTSEGPQPFLIGPNGQAVVVSAAEAARPPAGYSVPSAAQQAWTQNEFAYKNPNYYQTTDQITAAGVPGAAPLPQTGSTAPTNPNDDKASELRSARALITQSLADLDLSSEADWAYQMLVEDLSVPEIMLQLRKRPAYLERFQANTLRKSAGLDQWSEGTIIDYERQFRQTLREWGVPAELYDTTAEIAQFIGKDLSVPEVNRRIQNGYAKVVEAPATREQFRQWYGADGDTALAMWFFDNEKSMPLLERQAGAATLGGIGTRYGTTLSKDKAERLIAAGVNLSAAPDAFMRLGQIDPLFHETVSEKQDLTADEQGVDYVFGQSAAAEAVLNRRLEDRTAAVSGGGAAKLGSQSTGFGSARK